MKIVTTVRLVIKCNVQYSGTVIFLFQSLDGAAQLEKMSSFTVIIFSSLHTFTFSYSLLNQHIFSGMFSFRFFLNKIASIRSLSSRARLRFSSSAPPVSPSR